jgi:GH25 family lysozyme M1 (1,4-beta-N-acetylmuramidase)
VTVAGIDTSDDQIITDPAAAIASGRTFLIRKAGEGLSGPGAGVGANNCVPEVAAWKAAGGQAGIYWFVHPADSGVAQAQAAVAIARQTGVNLIACDCEVTDGLDWPAIMATMRSFLGYIAAAGLSVLLYDNQSWVKQIGAEQWGYPVWLAAPGVSSPPDPCACWQFGQAVVPGVVKACDLDQWTGTAAQYAKAFASPAPAPPAPVIIEYPEDNMKSTAITVEMVAGFGFVDLAGIGITAADVVSEQTEGQAPEVQPTNAPLPIYLRTDSPSADHPNGTVVFGSPPAGQVPNGNYGVVIWSVTPAPAG